MVIKKFPLNSSKPHFKNLKPDVMLYIRNLEKENAKLQSEIAKLKVANFSITNKHIAYEKEIVALIKKQSNAINPKVIYYGSTKEIDISENLK